MNRIDGGAYMGAILARLNKAKHAMCNKSICPEGSCDSCIFDAKPLEFAKWLHEHTGKIIEDNK